MKRPTDKALHTRNALLDAAIAVFHQRGVAHASLEEIAQTAGLSRGAVYWHFKNKEDLFEALCERQFARIPAEDVFKEEGDAAAGTLSMVAAIYSAFYRQLAEDTLMRQFYTVLHLQCEETPDNASIMRILRRYRALRRQQLLDTLTSSQQQGALPADLDVEAACTLLVCALYGVTAQWLSAPDSFDLARQGPIYVQSCMYMIAHAPHLRRGYVQCSADQQP